MRNEKWLSRKFREKCKGSDLEIFNFESAWCLGAPDLYLVNPVVGGFWVELKVVNSPQCKIPFRKGQPQWLEANARAGGCAWVLVLSNKEEPGLWLLSSSYAKSLALLKLREIPKEMIAGKFHTSSEWGKLKEVLCSRPRPRLP
jgi:hypothetical protein